MSELDLSVGLQIPATIRTNDPVLRQAWEQLARIVNYHLKQAGTTGVESVTATTPVLSSGGDNPVISIKIADSGHVGVVKPDGSTITIDPDGTLHGAATPPAGVLSVTASAPVASSGGANPNITIAKATTAAVGVVKPDGTTITIDANGTISAIAAPSGVTAVTATSPLASTGGTTPNLSVSLGSTLAVLSGAIEMARRFTVSFTTGTLAINATESGVVSICRAFKLISLSANVASRVRLYATTVLRDADLSRPFSSNLLMQPYIGTPSGVMGDWRMITTFTGFTCTPPADVENSEIPPNSNVPYNVQNLSAGPVAVTVTLVCRKMEV